MKARLTAWRAVLSVATPTAVLATLTCCALPIVLVSVGAGSAVASMVGALPWLSPLTRHKEWAFSLAALLLAVNYWSLYRSRAAVCRQGGVCHPSHPVGRWMRRAFWGSVVLYVTAFVAAYLSLPISRLVGR